IVASMALMASASSAYAIVGPNPASSTAPSSIHPRPTPAPVCISKWEDETGAEFATACDLTSSNYRYGREILSNGCAEGQVALLTTSNIHVPACPTFVQL